MIFLGILLPLDSEHTEFVTGSLVCSPTNTKTLRHRRYNKPEDFEIVKVPLPTLRDGDVLVKVKACGVCGTGMEPNS